MDQQKKADNYEKELKSQLCDLQVILATRTGFLQYYYKIVGQCKSQKAAFNVVNYLYFLLFDEELFASYNAFKMYKNRKLKPKK